MTEQSHESRCLDPTAFFYPKEGLSFKKFKSSDNPPVDPARVRPPVVVPFVTSDGGREISRISRADLAAAAGELACTQKVELIPDLFGVSGYFWNHAVDDQSVAHADRPALGRYLFSTGHFQFVASAGVVDPPLLRLKLTTPALLATGSAISDISSVAFEVEGSAHVYFKVRRGDGRHAIFYRVLSSPRKILKIVVTPDDSLHGLEVYDLFSDNWDYKPGVADTYAWCGSKEGSGSGVTCDFTVSLEGERSSVRLVDIVRSKPDV